MELKAGVIRTPHNEGISFDRDSSRIAVTEDETEFYLKSEADKLIAELVSLNLQNNSRRQNADNQGGELPAPCTHWRMDEGGEVMCDLCKDIGNEVKPILTHELDVGYGNLCEYGVYLYRQDGKVYLSLCDANNGETSYMEIHNCPMCGRKLVETK